MKERPTVPRPVLREPTDRAVDAPDGAEKPPRNGKADPRSKMVGVRALGEWLDLDRSTIHRMHNRGELPPAFKIGGVLRWYRRDIEAWLEQRRVQRGPIPRRRGSRGRTRRPSPRGGPGGPHA